MRKFLTITALGFAGIYLALLMVLGSAPVQKRVLAELQAALREYGVELQMESIEFSAFSARVYLNRVRLSTEPKAPVRLDQPLAVDKIKIEFQPLALIYSQILIDDLVLFHPRIAIEDFESLKKQILKLTESNKSNSKTPPRYSVVLRRVGMVDALVNLRLQEPKMAFRTASLTFFLQNTAGEQRSASLETTNLEIERAGLRHLVRSAQFDVDFTPKSVRINRANLHSDEIRFSVKGVSSLPIDEKEGPTLANASYELEFGLEALSRIKELKLPAMAGKVAATGLLRKTGNNFGTDGTLRYDGVMLRGYRLGSGTTGYDVTNRKARLSDLALQYGEGELRGKSVEIDLAGNFPVRGKLHFAGLRLESVLDSVKAHGVPIRLQTEGEFDIDGTLQSPFNLRAKIQKGKLKHLVVLQKNEKGVTPENTVLKIEQGTLDGLLSFFLERMEFEAKVDALGGKLETQGTIGFDDTAQVKARGDKLSLNDLGEIGDLKLGGAASLAAEIEFKNDQVRVAGTFDVENGKVAKIFLGPVKGEAYYQNELLTFERLEIPSLEPVRGNGFVDFRGKGVLYKFTADAKRIRVDQAFDALKEIKLAFPPPVGGEASAHIQVQGGGGERMVEVSTSGVAKNIEWYGEEFTSASFSMKYTDEDTDLERMILMKRTGAVELRGRFRPQGSKLEVTCHAMPIESLARFAKTPVTGSVVGRWVIEGEPGQFMKNGYGELKLVKSAFRGNPLVDSSFRLGSEKGQLVVEADLVGGQAKMRWARLSDQKGQLSARFKDFDFTPVFALLSGKELPLLARFRSTGYLKTEGVLTDIETWRGDGRLDSVQIDLSGAKLANKAPVAMAFGQSGVKVGTLSLEGNDSKIEVGLAYSPNKSVDFRADGRIDLEHIHAFIPGLEYGAGKLDLGVRLSGHPDRFEMLGDVRLDDGTLRLTGLNDEFKLVQARLSLSQDRINVDRFRATVGGGTLSASGDLRVNRFRSLAANLKLNAEKVQLKTRDFLENRFSGDFTLKGNATPYTLAGECQLLESVLSRFDTGGGAEKRDTSDPILNFNIRCRADDKLYVRTDLMDAEFRGNLRLVGSEVRIGLLGDVEALRGNVFFRQTSFGLTAGTVRFESETEILPRFNVSGRAFVREQKTVPAQEYEIGLQAFGTPTDYRIQLNSAPALTEPEIISLLVLGVTSRGQDGNYVDFGTTIAGQIPLQSKLQNELGVDIKIRTQTAGQQGSLQRPAAAASKNTDPAAPAVQLRKSISDRTAVSYSNTLDTSAVSEFKIEQMLSENLTVNATVERNQGSSQAQPSQSYGLDVRYRFEFE